MTSEPASGPPSPSHVFAAVHTIEFADTDAAGVVHFSAYFRLMEATEHAFYRSLGGSGFVEDAHGRLGMPRVSASCDFLRLIRFEDEVEVRLRVGEVGERRIAYEFEFRLRPALELAATGAMTVVHARRSSGGRFASAPLPPFLRDAVCAQAPSPSTPQVAASAPSTTRARAANSSINRTSA